MSTAMGTFPGAAQSLSELRRSGSAWAARACAVTGEERRWKRQIGFMQGDRSNNKQKDNGSQVQTLRGVKGKLD